MKKFPIGKGFEHCRLYACIDGQYLLGTKTKDEDKVYLIGSEIKLQFFLKSFEDFGSNLITDKKQNKFYLEYHSQFLKRQYYNIFTKEKVELEGIPLQYPGQFKWVKIDDIGIISGISLNKNSLFKKDKFDFFLEAIEINDNEVLIFHIRKWDGISFKIMEICEDGGQVDTVCISPDKLTAAFLIKYKDESYEVVIIDLE